MPSIYSNIDLERKLSIIKKSLYDDGFYSSQVVCRIKHTTGGDDIFDLDGETTVTDTVINVIVERGPLIFQYNNQIEVADGDIKLTVRRDDMIYVNKADEIWIGVDIVDNIPVYTDSTGYNFTEGKNYIVRSKKPSILGLDEIYILKMNGELE